MPRILHHRSPESISKSQFSLFHTANDETKDVNHEYTGSSTRTNYKRFSRNYRGRISNQIIYSGEIT